ncbi:hypothetical protein GJ744_009014 [Endocarpon pusillum]|uniref:Rhodopsin domain-containing protein n=1 Tax=Endocarpon pusillum TaxID=364733 RepID=A0A8H7AIN2_9EURO|nr:hypothetical protein GJ744_009014 [Endocarpon pusillum]
MPESALIGTPPATESDYWIVRSFLLSAGIPAENVDPSQGASFPPFRPPPDQYVFETRGPEMITGASIAIGTMLFFTITRILLRSFKSGLRWGADDYLIIPGVILAVAYTALQIAVAQYGGCGKHLYDITYHEFYISNKLGNIGKICFFISVGVIKMSIVMFNRRLTGLTSARWMIAHWTFFALLVIYILCALFMTVFQCNPQEASFDLIAAGKLNSPKKCLSENQIGISLSTIHVVMDFCLLSVPIIVLWKVQMSWSAKFRFFVIFFIGAMSSIGSVLRQITQANLKTDILYNYVDLFTWTSVDLTCGVIAANLPTLGVIIPRTRKDLYKTFSYFSSTKTSGSRPSFHGGHKPIGNSTVVPRSTSDDSQVGTLYHPDDFELHPSQTKGSDATKFPYTSETEEWIHDGGYERHHMGNDAKV